MVKVGKIFSVLRLKRKKKAYRSPKNQSQTDSIIFNFDLNAENIVEKAVTRSNDFNLVEAKPHNRCTSPKVMLSSGNAVQLQNGSPRLFVETDSSIVGDYEVAKHPDSQSNTSTYQKTEDQSVDTHSMQQHNVQLSVEISVNEINIESQSFTLNKTPKCSSSNNHESPSTTKNIDLFHEPQQLLMVLTVSASIVDKAIDESVNLYLKKNNRKNNNACSDSVAKPPLTQKIKQPQSIDHDIKVCHQTKARIQTISAKNRRIVKPKCFLSKQFNTTNTADVCKYVCHAPKQVKVDLLYPKCSLKKFNKSTGPKLASDARILERKRYEQAKQIRMQLKDAEFKRNQLMQQQKEKAEIREWRKTLYVKASKVRTYKQTKIVLPKRKLYAPEVPIYDRACKENQQHIQKLFKMRVIQDIQLGLPKSKIFANMQINEKMLNPTVPIKPGLNKGNQIDSLKKLRLRAEN